MENFCISDTAKESTASTIPNSSTSLVSEGVPYILCVQDKQRSVLNLVCEALEGLGYNVVYVGDNEYALCMIMISQPDVLLVDLTRRGSEGWQTYQAVKQDTALKSIIVIDVSARNTQLRYSKVSKFPAVDDDVPQPADIDRLVQAIKALARKQ